MLKFLSAIFLSAIMLTAESGPMPEQAQRGKAIFLESPQAGSRCANCHSLEGRGRSIGPDIRRLAGLSPKALRIAIESTLTAYVMIANLKNGNSFPSMKGEETDTAIVLFDVSKMPPVEATYKKSDVASYSPNQRWKHPPTSEHLTDQQIADLIGYLWFVARGDTRTVTPEEVQ